LAELKSGAAESEPSSVGAKMKIAVIGTGYVGLVTGACLANTGNTVTCVDIDEQKIASLRRGEIPIYEMKLSEVVVRNIAAERLFFTTDAPSAIHSAEVIFIAVGTPSDEDGSADLQHVIKVAATIGEHLQHPKIVVVKSTVPVGTCDRVRAEIAKHTDIEFHVASNPEFLKEGSAVDDFQSPDRVIIGSDHDETAQTIGDLYRPFMRRSDRIVCMDIRSAEMTKYASNVMLATKISFINEIANLCEHTGADVEAVRRGISLDTRIGPHFIYPGVGYGGSCFPKDVRALTRLGADVDCPIDLISAVDRVNNRQKGKLVHTLVQEFGDLKDRKIAVWGLSFKPNTDDTREAPAIESIRQIVALGATVAATDPIAIARAKEELDVLGDRVAFHSKAYDTLNDADALLIFTEWSEYRSPDFERIRSLMAQPLIVDGRNLYRPKRLAQLGFRYYSIGRPTQG
jgi:UDPglucose 6-dehydrogenase